MSELFPLKKHNDRGGFLFSWRYSQIVSLFWICSSSSSCKSFFKTKTSSAFKTFEVGFQIRSAYIKSLFRNIVYTSTQYLINCYCLILSHPEAMRVIKKWIKPVHIKVSKSQKIFFSRLQFLQRMNEKIISVSPSL